MVRGNIINTFFFCFVLGFLRHMMFLEHDMDFIIFMLLYAWILPSILEFIPLLLWKWDLIWIYFITFMEVIFEWCGVLWKLFAKWLRGILKFDNICSLWIISISKGEITYPFLILNTGVKREILKWDFWLENSGANYRLPMLSCWFG